MSELSDFINDDLYPALFSRIGDAFPEMSFKKVGSKWCSHKKLDGSDSSPRRNDKTVITSKVPHRALEQGGGSVDLVSLFLDMNRNTCSSNIDAIKALAKICNLEVPPMQDSESYRIYKEKQDALLAQASAVDSTFTTWIFVLGILMLLLLLPSLAVLTRRLHDTGRSGWIIVLNFIPVVNIVTIIMTFIYTVMDSKPEDNKYGPSPKYIPQE